MNSNNKIYFVGAFALILGLALGYFLFNGKGVSNSSISADSGASTSASDEIFTCSMHPQIRQNEFGICPICEMDLTPISSNSSSDPLVLEMTAEAVKLSNIQTTKVGIDGNRAAVNTLQLTGKIQADERLAVSQVAHIGGRIEQLFVTFTGEQIKKGQKLALIYSPDLIAAQSELLEALKLKEISPNLLKSARNKLRFLKFSDSSIEAIEMRGTIQENFTIYADNSGVITQKRVKVGDHLRIGEALFDLVNLNRVWVLFDAYEEDLSRVKIGDKIEFSTPALPNQIFTTKITFIDPIINPKTRVASLRGEVKNSKKLLKPEMLLTGVLKSKIAVKNAILTIPKSAVLWTGKRSVVYVKLQDIEIPSFQFREIEIGEDFGNNYQVISGIEQGEEVVTYGNFTIDAAAQLNNQASMMNRNVEIKKEIVQEKTPNFIAETSNKTKKKLEIIALKYLDIKEALVATNQDLALVHGKEFMKTLNSIKVEFKTTEAQEYWAQQLDILQTHGNLLIKQGRVEKQRKQFSFLSNAIIQILEAFGAAETPFYVQHCPMAFDNEGGDWLSKEEGIQNPYFGDKMMKCGLIKREILAKD